MPVERGGEREVAIDVAFLDHRKHRVAAAVEILVQSLVERPKPSLDGTQQEDVEIAVECRIPKSDNVSISWECRDAIDPFLRRNQLELGLEHDPGRTPGVKNETHVVARERQNSRRLLDGHNSNGLDHSGIANDAVTVLVYKQKTASEITSDRGRSHGRRIHHQLLARCQSRFERCANNCPGLHANAAGFHRRDLVEAGHVNEHAPFEGYRLPVVARPTAPNGQWNSMLDGCHYHSGDFLLAPRLNHDVRQAILKLRGKHRAVPVKVVGLLASLTLINRRTDIADVLAKLLDQRSTCHFVLLKLRRRGSNLPAAPRTASRAFFLR